MEPLEEIEMTPETFGILIARVIKKIPSSQNWLLVYQSLEEGGQDLDHVEEVRPFIERLAAMKFQGEGE